MGDAAALAGAKRERAIIKNWPGVSPPPADDVHPISRLWAGCKKLTVEEETLDFVTDICECAFPPREGRTITAGSPKSNFNYIFNYNDFRFMSLSVTEYAGHRDSASLAIRVGDLIEILFVEERCLSSSLVYLFGIGGRVVSTTG